MEQIRKVQEEVVEDSCTIDRSFRNPANKSGHPGNMDRDAFSARHSRKRVASALWPFNGGELTRRSDLIELCRQLWLAHVMEYVAQQQDEQISELMEKLLLAECEGRRWAKLGKLVQQAGFPHLKAFNGYVDDHITFPSGHTLDTLRELMWLKQKENLLLMGAVGTGKNHMATALGVEACRQGQLDLLIWMRSVMSHSARQAQSYYLT